jgi:hypothetical protein
MLHLQVLVVLVVLVTFLVQYVLPVRYSPVNLQSHQAIAVNTQAFDQRVCWAEVYFKVASLADDARLLRWMRWGFEVDTEVFPWYYNASGQIFACGFVCVCMCVCARHWAILPLGNSWCYSMYVYVCLCYLCLFLPSTTSLWHICSALGIIWR